MGMEGPLCTSLINFMMIFRYRYTIGKKNPLSGMGYQFSFIGIFFSNFNRNANKLRSFNGLVLSCPLGYYCIDLYEIYHKGRKSGITFGGCDLNRLGIRREKGSETGIFMISIQ